MKEAFGTEFVILNDVQQELNRDIFGPGWIHIASFVRGLKEYMCFKRAHTNKVYIEELDPTNKHLFVQIENDAEWEDAYHFLMERGLLTVQKEKEFKIAKRQ